MKPRSLGNLEQEVMDVIWKYKKCSVRDVLLQLSKSKKYAYTTIATILKRLNEKGLVTKIKVGESHIYSPKLTRESYTKNVAQAFLKRFINSFGDTAVASFAQSIDQLPKDKRKYFLKLLENNEKSK